MNSAQIRLARLAARKARVVSLTEAAKLAAAAYEASPCDVTFQAWNLALNALSSARI